MSLREMVNVRLDIAKMTLFSLIISTFLIMGMLAVGIVVTNQRAEDQMAQNTRAVQCMIEEMSAHREVTNDFFQHVAEEVERFTFERPAQPPFETNLPPDICEEFMTDESARERLQSDRASLAED